MGIGRRRGSKDRNSQWEDKSGKGQEDCRLAGEFERRNANEAEGISVNWEM